MKHLIRYKNRKIYDSDIRNYVTLEDIKNMILNGFNVVVEDRETGKDVTSMVLSHVISDVVAKEQRISALTLKEIILKAYNCVDEKQQLNYNN